MKVLITATVVKTHIMQFHLPLIKMLSDNGWTVDVAAKNDYAGKGRCNIPNCGQFFDVPFDRNPFSSSNIKAYKQLKNIIDTGDYDVVHANTPVGGIITRLAARSARKKGCRVFYMAHGFHFYKGAPLKNWLLYYPAEKICSGMTDVLMTINQEDYALACKRMKPVKNEYVPGIGINIDRFRNTEAKGNDPAGKTVILSIGELIERKNHESVIRAIQKLNDPNIEYRICGDGVLKEHLRSVIKDAGLEDQVKLLGYRHDIPDQLAQADLFILPSFQEGLPVALMEAMASRTMVLASNIRGNTDLLEDACLFDPKDIDDIARKIKQTLDSDTQTAIRRNFDHLEHFSESVVQDKMKEIYEM